MTKILFRLLAALILLGSLPAVATAQDIVSNAVHQFLRKETQGLPGIVTFTVGSLDPRTQLSPCPAVEAFQPAGGKLWGRTAVGVRCTAPNGWVVYVPVQISVTANYLATAKPLNQGQTISLSDVMTQSGDLAALPSGIITEAKQALGKTLRNSVGAGQPLRTDMLMAPYIIKQGQAVKLIAKGIGFSASGDGISLGNAADGQTVQIRTPAGTTISGIARPGNIVEVGNF